MKQYKESENQDRFQGDIDTHWIPKCPAGKADAQEHCKDDQKIQFRAQVAYDRIKKTDANPDPPPLYMIDMNKGAWLDARWPDPEFIQLSVRPGGGSDGTFRVAHTLTPEIGLYINAGIAYEGEIKLDANSLIKYLPNSEFKYAASGLVKFRPWAFESVKLNVKGTDLSTSKLFGITFQQIGDIIGAQIGGVIEGSFNFNATTDTIFSYQTTQITIEGVTGAIASADGVFEVETPEGDYLEVLGSIGGVIRYQGTIDFMPVISITSVGGLPIKLDIGVGVATVKLPFAEASMPVKFPSEVCHIPLPNVFVPSTKLSYPTTETGSKADKKVSIENTGELGAILTITSSNKQFKVSPTSKEMSPEDQFNLTVTFQPTKSGKQTATITVNSNDPDSPVQTFQVTGIGEGEDLEDDDDDEPGTGKPGASGWGAPDDGCACSIPAYSGTGVGSAALLIGLAALGVRRRRR